MEGGFGVGELGIVGEVIPFVGISLNLVEFLASFRIMDVAIVAIDYSVGAGIHPWEEDIAVLSDFRIF